MTISFGHMEYYAVPVVFLLYASRDAVRFMSNRLSVFLGRISFPLYVMHQHIQVTVLSGLIILGHNQGWPVDYWFMAWTTAVDLLVTIVAAVIVQKLEAIYLIWLDRLANLFIIKDAPQELPLFATVQHYESLEPQVIELGTTASCIPNTLVE